MDIELESINKYIRYYTNKIERKNNHNEGSFSLEYYESELLFWQKEKEKYL
jgi:hypothetical protein